MLGIVMGKVHNIQEQMDDISREMETINNDWKRELEIKSPVIGKKNAFDGFISSLDITKEKISGLKDVSIEASKIEKQRGKKNEWKR